MSNKTLVKYRQNKKIKK